VSQEAHFFCNIHLMYSTRYIISCAITPNAQQVQKTAPNQIWLSNGSRVKLCVCHREKRVQLIGHWSDDQLACENSLAVKGKNIRAHNCLKEQSVRRRWSAKQQMRGEITRGKHALALQQPPLITCCFLLLVVRSLT
jgi:hypothetical protein